MVPKHLESIETCLGAGVSDSPAPGYDSEQIPGVSPAKSIDTTSQLFWRGCTYPFKVGVRGWIEY